MVVERSSRQANEGRLGLIEEVTVEGPSKKDPTVTTGRTRRNTLLHFRAEQPIRAGSYATVEVTGAATNHLTGELIELTRAPRHRTRIPVNAG